MTEPLRVNFESRRAARIASEQLRERLGADWTPEDERQLAEWYQQLDDEQAGSAPATPDARECPSCGRDCCDPGYCCYGLGCAPSGGGGE